MRVGLWAVGGRLIAAITSTSTKLHRGSGHLLPRFQVRTSTLMSSSLLSWAERASLVLRASFKDIRRTALVALVATFVQEELRLRITVGG